VVGLPALRLTGIQLALVTLGVAVAFPVIARQFPKLTGGVSGRPVHSVVDPPSWAPPGLDEPTAFRFAVSVAVCLVGFWLAYNLTHSRVGRAMRAVRDDPTAAVASGIDLTGIRLGAFAFGAALAGMAGALQVMLFPFVSHDQFDVFLSLRLYAAAVVGGLVSIFGAITGVIALVAIPRINDAVGFLDNDTIVFGLGLIVLTFVAPDGIVGLYRRGRRRWAGRRGAGGESRSSDDDGAPDGPTLRPTASARRLHGG
jgi:branched-chain amino acid transport system permease protein